LYAPWDFDTATYRLPRVLYWWSAHHWYWIGTVDHRLDYSSTGFEWQMLPIMELTRSDRLLFLVNWIPFLLLPGLVFSIYRAFGINSRSACRWMWLLPSGYCYALQCSGLENDGYAVNYLLAAIAFANFAYHSRRAAGFWLALLAAALMTGAKFSNVPLLLPVGVLLLSVLWRVPWLNWRLAVIGAIALLCSCVPLVFFNLQKTGGWTGDPADQWHVRAHNPVGAAMVNVLLVAVDGSQPPVFPGNEHLNAALNPVNDSAAMEWLRQSHGDFKRIRYSTMDNAATAGPGFSLASYCVCLLGGFWLVGKNSISRNTAVSSLSLAWRLAPWLAWIAYGACLCKLGSVQSPRIVAPYYPLLLVVLLRSPRVALLERRKGYAVLAGFAAATTILIIVLTPSRPLAPVQTIARISHSSALDKAAGEYRIWENMRDDLAPLRAELPPEATRLGYGAGLSDTPYGLFQPLGHREIVELGAPLGTGPLAPPNLRFAVVTERGLKERYNLDLKTWLERAGGEIIYTYTRSVVMDAHSAPFYESWYLVKLNPSAGHT
jgi:hypothetical protein